MDERACFHKCISMREDNSYHLLCETRFGLNASFGVKGLPKWPCKAYNSSTCSHTLEALNPTPFSLLFPLDHHDLMILMMKLRFPPLTV